MEKKLPKGWVETRVGVISELIRGVTYKKQDASQTEVEDSYLILRGGNIQDEKIVAGKDEVYVDKSLVKNSQKVFKNDIVIVGSTGSKRLIGKAGIADCDLQNVAFGAFLILCRGNSLISKKFFSYFFSSNFYRERIRELAAGVNINNIRKEYINEMPFTLPPRAEQDRIVAKVDALMGQHAAIQQAMERIPQLLKDFRQQVLTQAVTGKLTEEWRVGKELENGLSRFKRQQQNRLSELGKKDKPNYLKYDVSDVLPHINDSWYKAPVGLTNDCIVPGRDKPKSFTGDIPWITTPDLTEDFIHSSRKEIGLTRVEIEEVSAKIIPSDSVIISIVGRFGLSAILTRNSVINQQLHAFLPSTFIRSKYLMYYFKTIEQEMQDLSSSTTIAYINKTKVNSLTIDVPSLEEQQEIVRRVESLFEKATAIEQRYEQLKMQIDTLPQSILHKAFKGELVEQLDSDGSAVELLEEIVKLKSKYKLKSKSKLISKPASSGSREVVGLKKSNIINNNLGEVAEDEVGYKKGEEN